MSASEITGEGQTGGSCSGCVSLSTMMHVAGVTVSSQVKRTEKLNDRRSFRDMEEPMPSLVNTRESAVVHTLSWLLRNNPWQERPFPQKRRAWKRADVLHTVMWVTPPAGAGESNGGAPCCPWPSAPLLCVARLPRLVLMSAVNAYRC